MNDEISEQAKKVLADNARRRAFDRLERDGAHATAALQRRVRPLAEERSIPPADIHKLMYKRIGTGDIMTFCKKYKVSFDWQLAGDLKGLKRMTQDRYLCKAQPKPESFKQNWLAFPNPSKRPSER